MEERRRWRFVESTSEHSVLQFYEHLAAEYHLIFADWKGAVFRQAEVLKRLIVQQMGPGPFSILDCSCGIGTQAIGLARLGYTVHATDLSPAAVDRAEREAASVGVSITFGVADFRALDTQVAGAFDIVLSCDNSLPHLLTDSDLRQAARGMGSRLRTGGLLVASIRDYDRLVVARPRTEGPRIFDAPEGQRIVFQVWDWTTDGRGYTVHLFIMREEAQEGQSAKEWQVAHFATKYRALLRGELDAILEEAGFSGIAWRMPGETGYHQPIATARKS